MNRTLPFVVSVTLALLAQGARADSASVDGIMSKLIEGDPWGMGGAELSAHLTLRDKSGAEQGLAFTARSRKHDAPYAKSLVRFTAPADLAGAGFLQIQNRGADDDRFLFLPELKRSRRISGNLRGGSFMGTDFSFADMDRRDLRESKAISKPDENVNSFPCFHLEVTPNRSDSPYSHFDIWTRKDNFVILKMELYDRSGVQAKVFTAQEVRRVDGHWYITKSKMVDRIHSHSTELAIESIRPRSDIDDDEFTVRQLEKF